MSQDMGANNYFSHTDSQGRDPFARMAAFGYNYNTWKGENLAAGTESAQAAFDMWRNSSGHNANMLNGNFTVIGIGRAYTAARGLAGTGRPISVVLAAANPHRLHHRRLPSSTAATPSASAATPPPPPPPPPEPEPTAPPTPEPTPAPTPSPTPTPVPAPEWSQIMTQVQPWWDRLIVIKEDGSLLRTVSHVAESYLEVKTGSAVRADGSNPGAPSS